jgi:Fibronectin type III domain/Bacterial Ig domain
MKMCKHGIILGQVFRTSWKLGICFLIAATIAGAAWGAQSVTLAWDANTETNLAGYNLYFGPQTGVYTNKITLGKTTTNAVNGLVSGSTYYFAVTAFNTAGAESDYSTEVSYLVPGSSNRPPTLGTIANRTIPEDAGIQTVALTGISSGASNEVQNLVVTATSSNPALIPTPTVTYTSPSTTGMLSFASVTNAFGSATITVTVNDGQSTSNTTSQSFTVTVNPVNDAPTLSAIPNQTVNQNSQSPAIPFSVTDAETPATALAVVATSSNPTLIPVSQITFGGSGTNRTMVLKPAFNQSGASTITVTVGDGTVTVSQPFVLTVTASNNPPVISAPATVVGNKNINKPIQGLSVSDPDATTGNLTLRLTVQHGKLLVATNVPGGLAGSHVALNNSSDVWIVAPLALINATLASSNGLGYLEITNFIGNDSLTSTINDNGNTGLGGPLSKSAQTTITVVGNGLDTWRAQYFSQSDLLDPSKEASVWGDKADPDNDGRDNLLEFALGLNPLKKDPNQGALDNTVVDIAGAKYAALAFIRRKNEPLLQYLPEVSGDGQTWTNGAANIKEVSVVSLGAIVEKVVCQDLTPILPSSSRYFRLRVLKN